MLSDEEAFKMFQENPASGNDTVTPTKNNSDVESKNKKDEIIGRALNFTVNDRNTENGLTHNVSTYDKYGDLSDVSMDDDDDEEMVEKAKILAMKNKDFKNSTLSKYAFFLVIY